MRKRTASLLFLPLLALAAKAASPTPDLHWMTGRWCSGDPGNLTEETWVAPRGGELLGVSRTLRDGNSVSFEFLRIATLDGVTTYFAQPGGRPPTPFARSAGGADWVRFENAAHDFPQRIEYRRTGDGLHAEIAGPGEGGKEMAFGVDYVACRD